ncbi:imidazole glycerol phosphate synthase subunit HisH [Nitrosopumilus piranensis]|uniref:Imidazole glycerol phosphate synthase subunit HisH n=1 Tax=Nitrosopumilus piranensis TaxID=1582439 RepID=A0A0C5BWF5_9ARCH|nr:imidazole glycerol phosphate synthase subunit HisH [Nitrosopumilus piranensis]AJM91310.1 imidazole glycerol phosphate synthase, glutamine amidotransferase subunit with HisF [Nitrosopumilus piranensis]
MTKIAIFDYGAGNIFSLKNALEKQNATVEVQTQADTLTGYDGIFLPGVGNFDPAIQSINRNSVDFLKVVGETPVFGICLGMEMFFEKSQEGKERGLGIISGDVVVLPDTLKVPHMGWNALEIKKESKILEGVENNSWVYFVHSYRVNPATQDVVVAESDYDIKVPAIVQKDNYFGTQFHPEKSGDVGALMLKNFLRECSK